MLLLGRSVDGGSECPAKAWVAQMYPQAEDASCVLVSSIGMRYPAEVRVGNPIVCMICLDEGVEDDSSFAFYEEQYCLGEDCVKSGSNGALTSLCEGCALKMDLMKASNKRQKRTLVCQCPWSSKVRRRHLAVARISTDQKTLTTQKCFPLSKDMQSAIVLKETFFTAKPDLEAIIKDPGVVKQHAMASYEKNEHGELVIQNTLNGGVGLNKHEMDVSLQILVDDDSVRLVGRTPTTTIDVEMVKPQVVSKGVRGGGGLTRGCSSGQQGTSSDSVARHVHQKNTDSSLVFTLPFACEAGSADKIEIVCDGVLPPTYIRGLMDNLEDDKNPVYVPSFCPIDAIHHIKTNVVLPFVSMPGQRKQQHADLAAFLGICAANKCEVAVDPANPAKLVIVRLDTGTHRIFKSINESLEICGFGAKATKWTWHVVVLRRGRRFLSLYILVVQSPTPGMWIIAEREYIGHTAQDCVRSFMMIGEDLAPYSEHTNGTFVVKRGLWKKEDMSKWFIGFTVQSILERCLTSDPAKYGPLPTACLAAGFLSQHHIKAAFVAQNKRICLEFARKNRDVSSDFLKGLMQEAELAKASASQPAARTRFVLPGHEVEVGRYGRLNVNVRQHDGKYDEEGERLHTVSTVSSSPVPCIKIVCDPELLIKITLHHNMGNHLTPYEEERKFYVETINENLLVEIDEIDQVWGQGYWVHELSPWLLSSGDINQWIVLRDCCDGTFILKIELQLAV